MMSRSISAALLALAVFAPATFAQDGPLRRAGRALDNTGKNVRSMVETEVARGQVSAQERDVLNRVVRRIEWDKRLVNSALRVEVRPGGAVVLRGSVINDAAKKQAVDLVVNTIGVTSLVDELAVLKEVKVIEVRPPAQVIEVMPPARVIEVTPPPQVIEVTPPPVVVTPPPVVSVPLETKVIVNP